MIERKFKELVHSFLHGEISAAEVSWIVEDLHRKRERRDLFNEIVEEFLRDFPNSGDESLAVRNLRELILRDLTTINDRDLRRAAPRQTTSYSAKDIEESQPKQMPEDEAPVREHRRRSQHSHFASSRPSGRERSVALPVIGILVLLTTLFLMIRFASVESDPQDMEGDLDSRLQREMTDSEAFRQAEEFLSEGFVLMDDDQESLVPDRVEPADDGESTIDDLPVSFSDLVEKTQEDSEVGSVPTIEIPGSPGQNPDSILQVEPSGGEN